MAEQVVGVVHLQGRLPQPQCLPMVVSLRSVPDQTVGVHDACDGVSLLVDVKVLCKFLRVGVNSASQY